MGGGDVLAWAAGLFDGEGNIGIDRIKANRKSGERSYKYRLRLRLAMTHRPTVQRFFEIFRVGSILPRKRYKDTEADQFVWACDGERAFHVLQLMHPHMVTKRKEAEIGMEFFVYNKSVSVPGRNGTSAVVLEARHNFHERLREAKREVKTYEHQRAGSCNP